MGAESCCWICLTGLSVQGNMNWKMPSHTSENWVAFHLAGFCARIPGTGTGNRLFTKEKQHINLYLVCCIKYIFFSLPFSCYLMTGCVIPICKCACPLALWCGLWAYHWNIPYQKTVLELHVLVRVAAGAIVYNVVLSKHCLHCLEFVWLYWQSCV